MSTPTFTDGQSVVEHLNLTFLLDTNAVITLEPFRGDAEPNHAVLAEFLRLAREHGHHVVTHPANEADFLETADTLHRDANLRALEKYERIDEPPISSELAEKAGNPEAGTNDYRDLRLLAALSAGAATHMVTSDERLIRKAVRLDLGERVLRPVEVKDFLRTLYPEDPTAPPQVKLVGAARLRLDEAIFDSLRTDYDFDNWVKTRVAPDMTRRTWVVEDSDSGYRAIAIVKPIDDHPLIAGKKAMKLSTFKVDAKAGGEKLGELLLKTVLAWAHEMRVDSVFVTVIKDDEKEQLVRFLDQFGFVDLGLLPSSQTESVFEKTLVPNPSVKVSDLEHHVLYGPPAIAPESPIYVIPIQPNWYAGLFPDGPSIDAALPGMSGIEIGPFGNAIRKAYLSNASIKSLPPGATILFYRSAPKRSGRRYSAGAVVAVGVVETTLRSFDPAEVLELVGRRTVYSADQVASMCESGVIAVLFRQDRFLPESWTLDELIAASVLRAQPQAIMQVSNSEGIKWVHQQLSA
jgi:GNAT superfamily N-acetyltransferase